jgi:hypothetical protein
MISDHINFNMLMSPVYFTNEIAIGSYLNDISTSLLHYKLIRAINNCHVWPGSSGLHHVEYIIRFTLSVTFQCQ